MECGMALSLSFAQSITSFLFSTESFSKALLAFIEKIFKHGKVVTIAYASFVV
jgi:hypothetical protein